MLSRRSEIAMKQMLLQSGDLFLGLFDGVPDGYGEGVPEVAYTGYDRQLIAFDGVIGVGAVHNSNVIEIPRPPEGFAAKSITHCGIYDSTGDLVLFGALRRNGIAAPYPLGHDSTFNIGVNGVQFDLVNVTDVASCNGV